MRTSLLAAALAAVTLLAGSAVADAASFAGTWTSKYNAQTTLELHLKPSGTAYSGTYSTITTVMVNKKKTTKTVNQPITATAAEVQKVPTLFVTITITQTQQPKGTASTATKPTVTFFCTLKSQKLSCQSPVTHKAIVFSPTK